MFGAILKVTNSFFEKKKYVKTVMKLLAMNNFILERPSYKKFLCSLISRLKSKNFLIVVKLDYKRYMYCTL